MSTETASPCRHAGTPPEGTINAATNAITSLSQDPALLAKYGISAEEYVKALPAAIERLRGRSAATNGDRRRFLISLFDLLVEKGLVSEVSCPKYSEDTVYRLSIPNIGPVAIIQKGCPDGKHSSVEWSVPDWAAESYIWWLCPSTKHQPGTHIAKGVNRLKKRFLQAVDQENVQERMIDGVIFHNEMCGTTIRPCPKINRAINIEGAPVPPPCLYVFPQVVANEAEWNWKGKRKLHFPQILFALFNIVEAETAFYTGHVGFQRNGESSRIKISSAFGAGMSTTARI